MTLYITLPVKDWSVSIGVLEAGRGLIAETDGHGWPSGRKISAISETDEGWMAVVPVGHGINLTQTETCQLSLPCLLR